ncbi:MAG: DUF4432 family protein, partial [Planctomycetes bacterium]|nr:DUF4432 family protein [Planctomycetota bacterium]
PNFRLRSRLCLQVGSPYFRIEDEVTNMGGVPACMELLYHCNFGPPFLGEGSRFRLPAKTVNARDDWAAQDLGTFDRYPAPSPGWPEQCYFIRPLADEKGLSLGLLSDAAEERAVAVEFQTEGLPWFTLWKNPAAEEDGYVTG